MGEQNHKTYLQFSPWAVDRLACNASGSLSNFDSDQHFLMAEVSEACLAPVSVHQCRHCQPTSQNYVQFLAETGQPEIQKQTSYDVSEQLPAFGVPSPSQLDVYLRPHNDGDFVTSVTGLEQLGIQEQKMNEEFTHAFGTYSQSCVAASKPPFEVNRKRSRERAYATDRYRKLRISLGLDALQELVPQPEGVGKAAWLDGVINHIKYLQYQMKDLCQKRLGGESTSTSVIFLEELGHYFVQDQILNGPLEEMIGKLISGYPSAANKLLQSRGLIVLPMTFGEGLRSTGTMMNIQGRSLASFNASKSNKSHSIGYLTWLAKGHEQPEKGDVPISK